MPEEDFFQVIDLNKGAISLTKPGEIVFTSSIPVHMSGVKFDNEKIRPELFPPDAFEALCDLYARGAKKYGDRNWEKGMSWGRLFGALMRHAWAWWRGESIDKELQLNHMLSVAWNAIGLYVYETRNIGTDDRPR